MKKKLNPREIREAKRQERLAAITAQSKSANDNPAAAEKPVEAKTLVVTENTDNRKSSNKAAGLKSTLVYGNKLYLTSFGKGNEAVIEQEVNTADYSISDIKSEPSLIIRSAGEISLDFTSSRPFVSQSELSAVNPLHSRKDKPGKTAGKDMLGLKDELEKRYFGKTFDDNIHIQIIHNILDIEKILAVYTANITAALDHMVDGDDVELINSDFIGYMSAINTYDEFMAPEKKFAAGDKRIASISNSRAKFEKLLTTRRLGYFGFDYDTKGRDKRRNEDTKKRLYHLIAFAGQLRQWSFHSAGAYPRAWLYQLDSPKLAQEYRDTLDYFFNERFDEINSNFVTQNATNLCILKEIFPDEDFRTAADLYYDFIVIKSQKNIGFSIKKLREKMLERDEAAPVKDKEMDTVRSKLYKLMDFCLFKFYREHPDNINDNVDRLRACTSDDMKEQFYTAEAGKLWERFGRQFLGFCNKIGNWVKDNHEKEIVKYIDKDAYRKNSNVSYFSKLLYVMCFFLDGKEINDLLTTLINKFDNIASFIRTAKELAVEIEFIKDYDFFNKCDSYVPEINIVKNISRMKKPSETVKKEMFRDALTVLGLPPEMDDAALDAELEKILEKKINPVTGKPEKGKNPFRNFIANNVIENRRFIYVIKFCNPENVRELVNNTKVTEFVLKRMPETQIDRYYEVCNTSGINPAADKKITALAGMIKNISFGDFRSVHQKTRTREEALEKERFKAVIGLYLTVVYLLIKNLVNVNARYVMAFHCLERDSILYNESVVWQENGRKKEDFLRLASKLCQEGENSRSAYLARNRRLRECVMTDLDNARKLGVTNWYRNIAAHLTAIRNCDEFISGISKIDSYFALYQYLIQKQIEKKVPGDNKRFSEVSRYFADLNKWNTYVKDMVKALNAPFGYNIPRFKNLSIDALFDRNEVRPVTDDEGSPGLDRQP